MAEVQPRESIGLRSRVASLRHGALYGAIGYLLVAAGLFGALGLSLGWGAAALSGVTLVMAAMLPGAALVRILLPHAGLLHYIVLGTTFGLMLWALGGFLSHVAGNYGVRWVPTFAVLALYAVVVARSRLPRRDPRPVPVLGALGAIAGVIAMIPALKTALSSQPTSWEGWVSLYPDLPFQAAIAADVAAQAPMETPWVAGTPLSYTWAFHSAMGVWSSTSSVPAFEVVLQVWPVVFTALIPGLIALVTWELSRSPWAAAMAPVLFTLAHGVLIAPGPFVQVPLFSISPTRDFGHLALLVVVLCLARTLGAGTVKVPWLIALTFAMVVATASKGSVLPILLGGVLTAAFMLLVMRRFRWSDVAALAAFGVGAVVGFVVAIPDTNSAQSLSWGPLTFLGTGIVNTPQLSLMIVGLLLAAIVGVWLLLGKSVDWILSSLIAGTMLAGVLGLALLSQTGGSQNYFWQGAEPLLSIALAWCGVILTQRYGLRVVVVAVAIALIGNLAIRVTSSPAVVTAAVVGLAVVGAAVILRAPRDRRSARVWLDGVIICLVLTQAAQLVGVSNGYVASVSSTADDESATHSSQLAAFQFMRADSSPGDIIATNAHCRTGSIAGGDCDPRRFMIAAATQRRVLVEGWGYTQNGNSIDWVRSQIELSDDFINAPTSARQQRLVELGVKYIFVDERLGYSPELEDYSTLVFESEFARVYRLS